MKEENTMITCCSDGTRPVIFKIERIDCKKTDNSTNSNAYVINILVFICT